MIPADPSRRVKLLSVIHHRFSLWHAPDWLKPRIERDFPQLEITLHDNYEDIECKIADAEIFLGWSLRGDQVKAAHRLRWIHSTAAAVHQLMTPELLGSDIVVTNARSVHGPVVAEHAIALIFALAKRLPACFRHQQQRHWAQEEIWELRPQEIADATLTIVGLGTIGEAIAKGARLLGMRVIAVRAHPERGPGSAHEVHGPANLAETLARADFVVIAAPVTPQTEKLITPERIAEMKTTAYLINVSRGSVIDEAALIAALKSGRIAGAALDVFEREPLPAQSELWTLPNVIVTPHTAGLTEKMWGRQYELLSDNLRRYFAGQPLRDIVDKRAGY